MIVLDASALLEALLPSRPGAPRALSLAHSDGAGLHAPHLLDVEIAQVVRRFVAKGDITPERGRDALRDLSLIPIKRHGHGFLLPRVWELRDNLTAYDAIYVALAEALDATLLTSDARLAAAPGVRARVELV